MDSNRRRFLGAAGVAAVASLTGCLKAAARLIPAGIRGGSEAAEELDDENNNRDNGEVVGRETNVTLDPDSDDSGDSDGPSWDGPECTDVTITDTDWQQSFNQGGEDTFTAVLLNEADYAGTVTLRLEFYESDAEQSLQGSIERDFGIGAQERIDARISAHPPTSESEWVLMSIPEQDC